MRKTTKLLFLLLLIEACVLGFLYFEKSNRSGPPMPNLASADEITRGELETMIADCVSPEDWANLASTFMSLGYYAEANSTFARACELNPGSAELAYDYGFCLGRTGEIGESNKQLEHAIELKHPKTVEAMFFIGRNHLRADDPDAAEAAFRKAAILPIAKYELAKILYRKDELDESVEVLRKLLSEEKDTVQSLALLSNVRKRQGDKLAALSNSIESRLHWSRRIPTPFGDERENLMKQYASMGYGKRLQDLYVKTNQRDSVAAMNGLKELQAVEWNMTAQDSLIKASNQSRRLHGAIDLLKEQIARFGPASKSYSRLGENLLEVEKVDEALEVWKIGAKLNSDDFGKNCYRNLSRYYLERKYDLEESQKYQSVGIIGFTTEALSHGRYEDALEFAEKAVKMSPKNPEAYYKMGQSLIGLGRKDVAIENFKKCLELSPTHGRSLMELEALGESEVP